MGLKEELEKIVQAKRQKIDDRDDADRDFYAEKKNRFTVLGNLLRELSDEIDPRHGEVKIFDDRARILLGRKQSSGVRSFREEDTDIEIEPDFEINLGTGTFTNLDGFRVEQTETYRYPEYDTFESTKRFPTEEDVMEYLLKEIGEKIAHYQHLDELAAKRDEKSRSEE